MKTGMTLGTNSICDASKPGGAGFWPLAAQSGQWISPGTTTAGCACACAGIGVRRQRQIGSHFVMD